MHARFRPSSELKMAAAASMAAHVVASSRPGRRMGGCTCRSEPPRFLVVSCDARPADVYSSLAAKILGPPTTFNAAKLKVEFAGVELRSNKQPSPFPGAYTLTHCDFTANLTLAVSGPMTSEQLAVDAAEGRRGGRVEGDDHHHQQQRRGEGDDAAGALLRQRRQPPAGAGRRFQILRLLQRAAAGACIPIPIATNRNNNLICFLWMDVKVLKAVVHGDAALFAERPELMEAKVWVHFHSSSRKYNRIECWRPPPGGTTCWILIWMAAGWTNCRAQSSPRASGEGSGRPRRQSSTPCSPFSSDFDSAACL